MKPLYLIIFAFSFSQLYSQSIDVVTGLNNPRSIQINGNEMFVSQYGVFDGSVSRFDITNPQPTLEDWATDLSGSNGMALVEDQLYIAMYNGYSISKININSTFATEQVVLGDVVPIDMKVSGNVLYFSRYFDGAISKIDLTESSPVLEDVITGLDSPNGILLNGNDLYVTEFDAGRISKIDLSAEVPVAEDFVTGLFGPSRLEIYQNVLYISEYLGNRITMVNLSVTEPIAETFIYGLDNPTGLLVVEDELYIAESSADKISRVSLTPTSIDEIQSDQNLTKISPNPSTEFITILGPIKNESFAIINSLGKILITGTTKENEKIKIQDLNSGLYHIKFERGNTLKFIKN